MSLIVTKSLDMQFVWISDVDQYSFIVAIFLKLKKNQFLQILVTCLSIDMCWSKDTPFNAILGDLRRVTTPCKVGLTCIL
jgi:hypothetical protein